jgi:hypothetical protein
MRWPQVGKSAGFRTKSLIVEHPRRGFNFFLLLTGWHGPGQKFCAHSILALTGGQAAFQVL